VPKIKTAPASLKKLTFEKLNRPNSLVPRSNKDDFLRFSHLFFGSSVEVNPLAIVQVATIQHPFLTFLTFQQEPETRNSQPTTRNPKLETPITSFPYSKTLLIFEDSILNLYDA